MTPKQVIAEIFRDYEYNLGSGMTTKQSLEILRAMLVDALEYEREKGFNTGVKSGRHAAHLEQLLGLKSKHPTPLKIEPSPHDKVSDY